MAFALLLNCGASASRCRRDLQSSSASLRGTRLCARPAVVSATTRPASFCIEATATFNGRLVVQGKGLDVSASIKDHIAKQLGHLSSFDELIREIDVRLSANEHRGPKVSKCEVTIYTKVKNGIVRAEKEDINLYAAIDDVADTVTRKMRKIKEERAKRSGARGEDKMVAHLPETPPELTTAAPVAAGHVPSLPEESVRHKYFHLKPMTVAEALAEMARRMG